MMQQVCINAMKPYNVTQKIQQKLAVARPISLLPSSHQTVPPRAIITHLKWPQNCKVTSSGNVTAYRYFPFT